MANASHDALTIRTDIFKHASTIAGVIATIYITFLLTGLKEKPVAYTFLIISIFAFLAVVFFSVFALANTASHIHNGDYSLTREVKISLIATYALLIIAFACTVIFTIANLSQLAAKKPQEVPEEVKVYVTNTLRAFKQDDIDSSIAKELQTLSSRIDQNFRKTMDERDKIIYELIENKLKEANYEAAPSSGKSSP